ncbi:MAG: iron complex transport system substrate-binding protein, partial [Ilumatobacter sp.]
MLPDEPSLSSTTSLGIEVGGTMRSTERSTRKKLIGAVVALAFVAAACGSDDAESTSTDAPSETEAPAQTDAPPETEAPVEAEPASTEAPADTTPAVAEEPGVPERVVSLSPTHTEIMFAIGAGDLLVAVDDFSNFPAEALELPNQLSGFEPNVEAIAAIEPDLVLIGGD